MFMIGNLNFFMIQQNSNPRFYKFNIEMRMVIDNYYQKYMRAIRILHEINIKTIPHLIQPRCS